MSKKSEKEQRAKRFSEAQAAKAEAAQRARDERFQKLLADQAKANAEYAEYKESEAYKKLHEQPVAESSYYSSEGQGLREAAKRDAAFTAPPGHIAVRYTDETQLRSLGCKRITETIDAFDAGWGDSPSPETQTFWALNGVPLRLIGDYYVIPAPHDKAE